MKQRNPLKHIMEQSMLIFCIILLECMVIAGCHGWMQGYTRQKQREQSAAKQFQRQIVSDLVYFPVPAAYQSEVIYEDTYGASRVQGAHEGCDIMDCENVEGRIPIISATDGTVTNIGWLYLGGYRIGITAESGLYYYYAHLSSYANGMETGRRVQAGELIGFMGSTGQGEEGTKGQFPVHLHFGIYKRGENGEEKAVNPYPYLLKIEER